MTKQKAAMLEERKKVMADADEATRASMLEERGRLQDKMKADMLEERHKLLQEAQDKAAAETEVLSKKNEQLQNEIDKENTNIISSRYRHFTGTAPPLCHSCGAITVSDPVSLILMNLDES